MLKEVLKHAFRRALKLRHAQVSKHLLVVAELKAKSWEGSEKRSVSHTDYGGQEK